MSNEEEETMKHEAEIAILSDRMEQLGIKVDDLKVTFKGMVEEIHRHIERKFADEMKIGLLQLKQEMTADTDTKIASSIDSIKGMIKTWAVLITLGVSGTIGVTSYISSTQQESFTVESKTTAQEMGELYKIISQENRKNVKQTEVIMNPERSAP